MLADDDVLLREGLAGLLGRSGFEVVGKLERSHCALTVSYGGRITLS